MARPALSGAATRKVRRRRQPGRVIGHHRLSNGTAALGLAVDGPAGRHACADPVRVERVEEVSAAFTLWGIGVAEQDGGATIPALAKKGFPSRCPLGAEDCLFT